MKKNRAIDIISTFSTKELKMFEDFLNSPFLNKNRKVIQLFGILKELHPKYDISDANLFGRIFGNASYRKSYLRNLFSDLNILVEEFLLSLHVTSKSDKSKFVIEELINRGLYDLVLKKMKILERSAGKHAMKDQEYYADMIFISDTKDLMNTDRSLSDRHTSLSIKRKICLSLLNLMESYFQCALEEQRIKISHDFGFLKISISYIRERLNEFKGEPLLMIYYLLWSVYFGDGTVAEFVKARKIFNSHFSNLSNFDRKNIYSSMQTVCLKRIDVNEESYRKTLSDILLELLSRSVTSHKKNLIDLNLYRNVLLSIFKLNDAKRLKKFINEYACLVKQESRNDINTYSEAHISFLEGDFQRSLELCNRVNFNRFFMSTNENLYFKNDVRMLTLKALYELSHFEMLLNHTDTYRHFLRNSRVMKDSQKQKSLKCIEYVKTLARLRNSFDHYTLHRLMENLKQEIDLNEKEWLLEKAMELSNKHSNRKP
jgi:hypothetical protein